MPVPVILKDSKGGTFGIDRVGNSPLVIAKPLNISIALDEIKGMSSIHKFGNTEDFDTSDNDVTIWGGADDAGIDEMNYTYSTSAAIDTISSDDAGDNQPIEIIGLDERWREVSQVAILSGFTQVTLAIPLIRVYRMFNLGTTNNAGHIYVFEQTVDAGGDGIPDDTTKIRALIHPGNNQTLMAVYTVPADKTGLLSSLFASTAGAKKTTAYDIDLLTRRFGSVFRVTHLGSVIEDGTSHWNHLFEIPQPLPPKTDIEIRVQITAAAVTEASVSAGFNIILIDD